MYDQTTGLHWDQETDAQRAASAIVPFKLTWDGAATRFMAPLTLQYGRAVLRVNAPARHRRGLRRGDGELRARALQPGGDRRRRAGG